MLTNQFLPFKDSKQNTLCAIMYTGLLSQCAELSISIPEVFSMVAWWEKMQKNE